MSNKEDLAAIDNYVRNRSAPAPGAPPAVIAKWQQLVAQWKSWHPKVASSWYVSDADLANAKAVRNALMKNQNPDAWQYVQETAADKPDRKKWIDRPKAPKPTKKPWEKKGLTYEQKVKAAADKAAKPPPTAEPKPEPKQEKKVEARAGMTLLGIPVNAKTVLGAVVGGAAGAVVTPLAVAVGIPIGFVGAAKLFPERAAEKGT